MRDIKLREIENHANYMFQYIANVLQLLGLEVLDKNVRISQYYQVGKIYDDDIINKYFPNQDKNIVYFGDFSKNSTMDFLYLDSKTRVGGNDTFAGFFNSIEKIDSTSFNFVGYRIEFPRGSDMGLLA